jgi:hypothetical protein
VSYAPRTDAANFQETDAETAVTTGTPVPRPLNTERSKEPQPTVGTTAKPAKTPPPKAPPPVTSEVVWPKDRPAEPERDDLIEQILVAGTELEREKGELPTLEPSHQGKPLTSDEMIARARQRWDRKP